MMRLDYVIKHTKELNELLDDLEVKSCDHN